MHIKQGLIILIVKNSNVGALFGRTRCTIVLINLYFFAISDFIDQISCFSCKMLNYIIEIRSIFIETKIEGLKLRIENPKQNPKSRRQKEKTKTRYLTQQRKKNGLISRTRESCDDHFIFISKNLHANCTWVAQWGFHVTAPCSK